jgi:hypothetical protein
MLWDGAGVKIACARRNSRALLWERRGMSSPFLLLCGFAAVVTGEARWVLEFEFDNQAVMYFAPHR